MKTLITGMQGITLFCSQCKSHFILFCFILLSIFYSHTGLAQEKYFGSILGPIDRNNEGWDVFFPDGFAQQFTQVTAENDAKWQDIEPNRDDINDTKALQIYNFALQNNLQYKFHTLMWGKDRHDETSWRGELSDQEIYEEVVEWFEYVAATYPETTYVDVVNEVLNEELSFADAFNGRVQQDFGKQYTNTISFDCDINENTDDQICNIEWVLWSFLKAREVFGSDVQLLINDFQIINKQPGQQRTKNATYKMIIEMLQSYDYEGQPIIDGIGIQSHTFNITENGGQNSATITEVLNDLGSTGLPIHISELDIARLDDTEQANEYERVLPLLWHHPSVVGITLWGHAVGRTWREGTGLIEYADDGSVINVRPAWDVITDFFHDNDEPENDFDTEVDPRIVTGRTGDDGEPIIHWRESFTITAAACADGMGSASYFMDVQASDLEMPADTPAPPATVQGEMDRLPDGSFIAEIDELWPIHGAQEFVISRTCNGISEDVVVNVYIDPSGQVKTLEGEGLIGATVTLFRQNDDSGVWEQVPSGSDIMAPYNRSNPDTTRAYGAFGWDVVTGFYKVRAEHPACFAPGNPGQTFVETETMFIPPEVTDLDIRLECPTLSNKLSVSHTKFNEWDSGYCANLTVTNNTQSALVWNAAFQLSDEVYQSWNFNYFQNGNLVTLQGVDWNRTLQPGESTYSTGFCANKGSDISSYPISVRARGTSGQERINLTVGGTIIASWTLSREFREYDFQTSLGGGINVEYINDGPDRDVVLDYVKINNVTHQAEEQTENSATWSGSCGAGSFSEWMHCNGYIGFSAFK